MNQISDDCYISIDTDSRFCDDPTDDEYEMYKKLPYDEIGYNNFWAKVVDNVLYYKNKKVLDLSEIEHCYKRDLEVEEDSDGEINLNLTKKDVGRKYKWYYFFVSKDELTEEGKKYCGNYLENRKLNFDGVEIYNAHVHFNILI